jgi:hypothetical protein
MLLELGGILFATTWYGKLIFIHGLINWLKKTT